MCDGECCGGGRRAGIEAGVAGVSGGEGMRAGGESENGIGGESVALAVEGESEATVDGLAVVEKSEAAAGKSVAGIADDVDARIKGRRAVRPRRECGDYSLRVLSDNGDRRFASFRCHSDGNGRRGCAAGKSAVAGIIGRDGVAAAGEKRGGAAECNARAAKTARHTPNLARRLGWACMDCPAWGGFARSLVYESIKFRR